jgi:hypothetical protein
LNDPSSDAGDYPGGKSELYSKRFKRIMDVMFLADEEAAARWKEPSLNWEVCHVRI